MSPELVSAGVAGVVSLAAGLLTFLSAKRAVHNERVLQEKEHNRRLTERLYELRLECYPRAFEITDRLRGECIFTDALTRNLPLQVLEELAEWNRSKAGFVLSTDSIKAFYRIRGALRQEPAEGEHHSTLQKRVIWEAKNSLRSALRSDLNLLYVEEELPREN